MFIVYKCEVCHIDNEENMENLDWVPVITATPNLIWSVDKIKIKLQCGHCGYLHTKELYR